MGSKDFLNEQRDCFERRLRLTTERDGLLGVHLLLSSFQGRSDLFIMHHE